MRIIVYLKLICLFVYGNSYQNNNYFVLNDNMNTSCKVSFSDLLYEGLQNHPSIAMSEDAIKASQYAVESARWEYFPTPSVDVSHKSGDYQTVARLDQPIWSGGRIDAEYDKAKSKKSEALYSLDEMRFNLIDKYFLTLQSYLESKQRIQLLLKNKKQFLSLGEMLDRMIEAGASSQSDKDLLLSRVSSIDADLVRTQSKMKLSKIQFEILTSKTIACQINYKHSTQFDRKQPIEMLVEQTIDFSPNLKRLEAQIKTAITEIDTAKSKLWPSLVIRGEHREGTIYDESDPETENLVYVAFQLQTGAGLSSISKVSEAKINVSKLKFEKQSKQKDIIDELISDYTTYITAQSNIQIVAENIIRAKNIYDSDKRLYMSGKKDWLDLINSLSKLNQEEIIHSKLIVEKQITSKKMDLKSGKINLENGEI